MMSGHLRMKLPERVKIIGRGAGRRRACGHTLQQASAGVQIGHIVGGETNYTHLAIGDVLDQALGGKFPERFANRHLAEAELFSQLALAQPLPQCELTLNDCRPQAINSEVLQLRVGWVDTGQ